MDARLAVCSVQEVPLYLTQDFAGCPKDRCKRLRVPQQVQPAAVLLIPDGPAFGSAKRCCGRCGAGNGVKMWSESLLRGECDLRERSSDKGIDVGEKQEQTGRKTGRLMYHLTSSSHVSR